jgi:hypothetical protein
MIVGALATIQTERIPNTSLERYRYTILLGYSFLHINRMKRTKATSKTDQLKM